MSIYNTPLEERFGEKLEELREEKNMTREQLADQVGLTARHIAALERGERRPTLTPFQCGNMPCSESDLIRKLFARHILFLAQFFQFLTETLL